MSRTAAPTSRRRPAPTPAGTSTFALLAALVAVLSTIGLVMVLSASSVQAFEETDSTWTYFVRHALYVAVGTAALVAAMRVDYRRWRRVAVPLLGLSWLLLVAVLVPGVGIEVNGAGRWVGSGAVRFQPAELVKLAALLFAADLLTRRADRMAEERVTLRPVLTVLIVTSGLMLLQPDLGSTLVIGAIVVAVLFVAGVPLLRLSAVVAAGGAAAVVLALRAPYRRRRILAFLDPSADPGNVGYHINQSLMGVASGGLLGVGLGASRAKYGFLPNAHTDFIFAIIAEELGLVGGLAVVACFVGFAVLGTKVAIAAPDRFGTLVAAGITAWVVVQAFVNIGGVIGILPITGVTLPFISYGGSSILLVMASCGILLNIARQGRGLARRSPAHPAERAARH
ncbi:MAG TPA: putative lipid II flippase FtsW [Acidimicrobiales bacterium]|nr:putative lipid II flippase FtsW [Acidimicrobiales bacterium]